MVSDNWLPTRIVFAVSDDWIAWITGIILLAILFGAWRFFLARRRARRSNEPTTRPAWDNPPRSVGSLRLDLHRDPMREWPVRRLGQPTG